MKKCPRQAKNFWGPFFEKFDGFWEKFRKILWVHNEKKPAAGKKFVNPFFARWRRVKIFPRTFSFSCEDRPPPKKKKIGDDDVWIDCIKSHCCQVSPRVSKPSQSRVICALELECRLVGEKGTEYGLSSLAQQENYYEGRHNRHCQQPPIAPSRGLRDIAADAHSGGCMVTSFFSIHIHNYYEILKLCEIILVIIQFNVEES